MNIFFFVISFLASIIGAICGIGGGVIIKPVMDMFNMGTVTQISFFSGCTVLSMSCYSVVKSMSAGEKEVDLKTGTPLAIGAAIGGVVGKQLFTVVKACFENQNMVGTIQAGCLAVITVGTLFYTLRKDRIKTLHITNLIICLAIGLVLGIMSSFLGIGGGPINLVVLYYFFSMKTKTAAANSLYIILFSQITSLFSTIFSNTVPEFSFVTLCLMVAGGITGGIAGRIFNKKMNQKAVEQLFIGLMVVIILICFYNIYNFAIN